MKIDAHHHFWNYDPVQYCWIDEDMKSIRRSFGPADLKREIDAAGIDGVVSVHARQNAAETPWLLDMAEANDFIRGVVGWVPLAELEVADELAALATRPKLKAVRHVVQGEPDPEFILRPDFNAGVAALRQFDLAYDILIFERQLPNTIKFVDKHPEQVFILDHIAKPRIKENVLSPWRELILDLARRPNVYCKISGMVTEADYHAWTPQQLKPYVDTVLEAFGPRRLMFGSDWPVCLVAVEYGRWHRLVKEFIAALSPAEQARILGGTAVEAYRL